MAQAIDMTGQKINHLTFLRRNTQKGSGYWDCQCDCGNIVTIRKDQVTRKKYPKQDCGCGLKERISKTNLKDEVGNRYGKLIVLYRTDDLRQGEARWHCKCDCGRECDVSGIHLRNHSVQSCGCLRIETGKENGIDETGHVYGKLTVLYKSKKTDGTHLFWHCRCECGNECDVNGTYLRTGVSTNCGCERSVGELKINNILKENNINFKREYTFPDLLGDGGGRLRFDFGILNQNDELQYLIEFDGIQHFQTECFGMDKEKFDILKKYDKIKNEYCKKNNIILIRIPYTKLKSLTLQDLIPKEIS